MRIRSALFYAGLVLGLANGCNAEGTNAMVNDPGRQSEQAVEVLSVLRQHGADLSQPRNTIHYFYDGDFRGLGEALKNLGYQVRPTADDDGVIAERTDILNDHWRVETLTQLSKLANQYGCEYDGWEAAMTPQTQQ